MTFFVTLASGRDFHFANPTPDMITLGDIAHHLSRENRWANNIEPVSFSVAEHSMLVAAACQLPQSRPYALLHDAAEMVLRDLPTPLKGFLLLLGADIISYERHLLKDVIFPAFGLPPMTKEVAADIDRADAIALATEYRDIVRGRNDNWKPQAKPLSTRVKWRPQPKVEEAFRIQLEQALRPFGKVN